MGGPPLTPNNRAVMPCAGRLRLFGLRSRWSLRTLNHMARQRSRSWFIFTLPASDRSLASSPATGRSTPSSPHSTTLRSASCPSSARLTATLRLRRVLGRALSRLRHEGEWKRPALPRSSTLQVVGRPHQLVIGSTPPAASCLRFSYLKAERHTTLAPLAWRSRSCFSRKNQAAPRHRGKLSPSCGIT